MDTLSTKQVAQRLGVHVATVRKLARQKKLDSFRVGTKLLRFTPAAVDAYIARQSAPPSHDFGPVHDSIRHLLPTNERK